MMAKPVLAPRQWDSRPQRATLSNDVDDIRQPGCTATRLQDQRFAPVEGKDVIVTRRPAELAHDLRRGKRGGLQRVIQRKPVLGHREIAHRVHPAIRAEPYDIGAGADEQQVVARATLHDVVPGCAI